MATVTIVYEADLPTDSTSTYTGSDGTVYYGSDNRVRGFGELTVIVPADVADPFCRKHSDGLFIGFEPCVQNMGIGPGCVFVPTGMDSSGVIFGDYVGGVNSPFVETADGQDYLSLGEFVSASDLSNALNPEFKSATFICEEDDPIMSKIWTKSINLKPGDNVIQVTSLSPSPDYNSYILWQSTIQITAFEKHLIDWVESSPKWYKFGFLSTLYFGCVNQRLPITAIDSYFGLYETLPTLAPFSDVQPGSVTFGQRLTARQRSNGLAVFLKPTVKAKLTLYVMQIYDGMAEYI